jgi:hypothetical protein
MAPYRYFGGTGERPAEIQYHEMMPTELNEGESNDPTLETGIMQTVEPVEATSEELSGLGGLSEVSSRLAQAGQEPLVHASPGEIIFDPNRLEENERNMLFAALEAAGIPPEKVTVGSDMMELNELTGLPAAGIGSFFKKIFKPVKKVFKKIGRFVKKNAGTILGIAGAITGQPWLAALGSGVGSLIEGKPIQNALLSAGLSFAGTKWVGPWIGKQLKGIEALGIGQSMNTSLGEALQGVPEIGGKLGTLAAEGSAVNAVANDALQKGVVAGLGEGATRKTVETAVQNALTAGNFAADRIADATTSLTNQAVSNITSKAVTTPLAASTLSAAGPGYGTLAQNLFSKPVGDLAGGAIAGLGAKAVEPMVSTMFFGIPQGEQDDVMAAWNQRYNYTPTADDLYQFYTTEYVPNQQVNVAQTIGGIPGYTGFAAAGGGYINGVGGPKSDSNLARLSDGEFVFTEAAVRGAGGGDRMKGARRMYNAMKELETRVA